MSLLVLRAYVQLMKCDLYITRGSFAGLHNKVHRHRVRNTTRRCNSIAELCHAIDVACIWYWKQVLCLQRSAATAISLKNSGFHAEMVIGAQQMPFRAHAWVEVDGQVVNDKVYMPEIYSVLDRS
jgi:transglutaminase superfamily protein